MTNHWVDLQNCKTILVEGSNVAENHPMAYKWIRKAQENGAKLIHVDPRYTRTSAGADVYARIRPGTDAAFQNTMINHIIVNKLYDEDYVVTHTNALYLGDEAFDFKDGLFSGYDAEHHKYDTKTWGYQLDAKGYPRIAKSLDDPHCVFSRLKTFVSRYTLEMGERITGVPADQIRQIAEMMAKNRPGSILYALGMTQHTTGVQGIRSFTILQLLLGNIGKPGGGVNALRGEPNVQGACDMAVLYNYYPGYLNSPTNAEPTIYHYVRKNGIADSRYLVNTLKAFFGEAATARTTMATTWLPKRDAAKDYGTLPMFEDALAGKLKLLWIVGQNPAVTLPNLKLTFEAMAKLETLVVQEIWETETAAFWRRPGVDPKSINTEVILLPAAFFMEKNGTISNSGGMVQWRHAAVKPPGQARPDGEIVDHVFRKVRDLVKDSKEPRDEIIRKASWTYTTAEDVLREINGYAVRDNPETGLKKGDLVRKVSDLRSPTVPPRPAPGSTRASSPTARTSRSAATRPRIREDSASIRASGGPGPTTCGSSTTGRRAIGTASRIRARNRSSGGTSRRSAGRDTTCRTSPSRPTAPTRRTVSGPSTSARRASDASSRRSTRTPTRGTPTIGATWPTCRRTARCRRCTSRSRAPWKTSFTRA